MDALDEIVVAKQRELEDLLRKVEKLEVEVKALTKAASLRPAPAKAWDEAPLRSRARAKTAKLKGRVGGKEPGTISNSWRDTLLFIDMLGDELTVANVINAARSNGLNINDNNARDRLRAFRQMGYLEGDAVAGYRFTAKFHERFREKAPDTEKVPEQA